MADRAKKNIKNPQTASKLALGGKAETKKHVRHGNIIHRVTSESIRLEAAGAGGAAGDSSCVVDLGAGSSTAGGGKHLVGPPGSRHQLRFHAKCCGGRGTQTKDFLVPDYVGRDEGWAPHWQQQQ